MFPSLTHVPTPTVPDCQRYGSHGIEFSPAFGLAFVPVLGTNSIEVYLHEAAGPLVHLASIPSPRGPSSHDGPRHIKVHPTGKVLYCVTEHCMSPPLSTLFLSDLTIVS